MKYRPKPGVGDPAAILTRRRVEILREYQANRLDHPIRIGGEPISMELALLLELLIDNPEQGQ